MYDELKKQAEELAEDKDTEDLARLGFIYAYIANHMTTHLSEQIDHVTELLSERISRQDKLLWGILITLALGVVANIIIRVA